MLCSCSLDLLLALAELSAAGLGVEVLVPGAVLVCHLSSHFLAASLSPAYNRPITIHLFLFVPLSLQSINPHTSQ